MEIQEYRSELLNDIKAESLEESLHEEVVFIRKLNDILLHDYSLINQELDYDCFVAPTTGTKAFKGMKLDAASLDVVTNTINLAICDYNPGEITRVNLEQINNAAQKMRAFCENVFKGFYSKNVEESLPIVQFVRSFAKNYKSINKIHMFLLSTNECGRNVKVIEQEPIVNSGKSFEVIFDIIDMQKIYNAMLPTFIKEDIQIDVDDYNTTIPCIKADIETDDYESYLAIVPGEFLADIYSKYGPRLLEDNVRSFLNVRGAVNKGIRGTILNEKDKFFTYNNGISTTARAITTKEIKGKGLCIQTMTGLQIINGGQTTASLANARIKDSADLKGIYVQMKLTITKEDNPELVRLISKYANSQNKVTNADLNSNHPFYKRIEDFSTGANKIMAPAVNGNVNQTSWFFERVRGQYEQPKMNMTKGEWDKYTRINPKNQKFTKTDLAKYINTFDMLPYFVSWGADVNATKFQEKIGDKWDKDNAQFNAEYFKNLVSKAIMFKHVEKLISNEEWYIENRAYRAQLVTYTIAKFMHCVEMTKKEMNYKEIWLNQEVPEIMDVDLKKIAKIIFDVIYDERRPHSNIGEYCKREICWNTVKAVNYELTDDTYNMLLSKEQVKEEERKAKKEQNQSNGITNEIEIFNKGAKYWESLMQRGLEQNVISYHEGQMLDLAKKYCEFKTVRSLSNLQTKEIEKVRIKLSEVGIE